MSVAMAAPSLRMAAAVIRDDGGRRPRLLRLAAFAVAATALLVSLPADAKDEPSHLLTLTGAATEPAGTGAAPRDPACLLRFSLRRLVKTPWRATAELTLEFADPREGRSGSLFGAVRLDLDDRGARRSMRIDGVDCDGLRPLNLHLACTTADGRCPSGLRIRLKNFDRLEIAEDVLAVD